SLAAGEVCAACGTVIAAEQLVMEATTKKAKGVNPIQFHTFSASSRGTTRGVSHESGLHQCRQSLTRAPPSALDCVPTPCPFHWPSSVSAPSYSWTGPQR